MRQTTYQVTIQRLKTRRHPKVDGEIMTHNIENAVIHGETGEILHK
jgi:hypothetical protein